MWLQLQYTEELKSMSKIQEAFKNKKAFIPFITGGDPALDVTKKLLLAMQEAGADLIEVGIPFSDPIAEGPVIQEADERALKGGCTTDKLFDAMKEIKDEMYVPRVFMTYVNAIYSYGKIAREAEGFLYCVSSLGVTGVRSEIKTDIGAMIRKVKEVSDIPCAVGFGIATPDQAKDMAAVADGVIVGSAIVKIVAKYGEECVPYVSDYVKSMKEAI